MNNCVMLGFSGIIANVNEKRTLERISQATGLGMGLLKEILLNPALMKENRKHLAVCMSIIAEEIQLAEPISGIKEAMEVMMRRNYSIVISSNGPWKAVKKWLEKNGLDKHVYLVYGLEDGSKDKHLEGLARIEEVYDWLFIGDSLKDFIQVKDWTGIRKVAVNANPEETYPKGVRVFCEPLSAQIAERITIGG